MDAASAECVCVTPCGQEAPVIAPWTIAHVWPPTSRSVTAEENVNVAPVSAPTPNSRVPPVKPAPPVQESALSTSKSGGCFYSSALYQAPKAEDNLKLHHFIVCVFTWAVSHSTGMFSSIHMWASCWDTIPIINRPMTAGSQMIQTNACSY